MTERTIKLVASVQEMARRVGAEFVPDAEKMGAFDPEIERILAMSDDEILAEVLAAGDDPDQIARDLRAMFDRVVLEHPATPAERTQEGDNE